MYPILAMTRFITSIWKFQNFLYSIFLFGEKVNHLFFLTIPNRNQIFKNVETDFFVKFFASKIVKTHY